MALWQKLTGGGLNKSCVLLIVLAGLERFAFKGVASNLVTYLTDVAKMSNSSAAKMVNTWCGVTSMVPLLVAQLADSYWDRYSTVQSGSLLYAMGLIALTFTAMKWPVIPASKLSSSSCLQLSLYLISLGQGAYNPSLQTFAADQFENQEQLPSHKADRGSDKKRIFFQWWYFGVCCGSLLGFSLMSYIQENLGWGLGFAIPAVSFVASIVIFSYGNRFYEHKKKAKSVNNKALETVIQTVKATFSRIIKGRKSDLNSSSIVAELELEEEKQPICGEVLEGKEGLYKKESEEDGNHFLQTVKVILPLLPVWTMLLMFAVIFQQPATFFTKQGMTMKRNIGTNFKIPPAALQSAITISIILLMPLYDVVFIPLIRVFTRNDKGISVMQRMGLGMLLSIVAMVIAAFTERKRLELSKNGSETVPLSIFWLLPQYILLGISDIFTVVGMQEFFYSEVPQEMRTTGIALYTSVFGFGSFLSVLLISLVEYFTSSTGNDHGWFADDMSKSRLDNYYWLLAILSSVCFVAFVVFSKLYTSSSG